MEGQRLLFGCANDEVCRAMKCKLDHAVHWSKSCAVLEIKGCFEEGGRGKEEGWEAKNKDRHKDREGDSLTIAEALGLPSAKSHPELLNGWSKLGKSIEWPLK